MLRKGTPEERLWRHTEKGPSDQCWIWNACKNNQGYGQINVKGRLVLVHRLSYEIHYGPVPQGMDVLHKCPGGGNPACVNPAHLKHGTHIENMHDMIRAGHHLAGEHHHWAKLSDEDVVAIFRAEGLHKEIAANFNIRQSMVSRIKSKTRRRRTLDALDSEPAAL